MTRRSGPPAARIPLLLAAGISILAQGCAGPDRAAAERERLRALVEDYFEEYLKLNPIFATFVGEDRYNDRLANDISPEHREQSLSLERRFLEEIEAVDASLLVDQDLLTHQIFRLDRQRRIEAFRYPDHLLPVDQFGGVPNHFARLGSGESIHPFRTVKDYDDFLARMSGFAIWVDQAIANMREGLGRGVVQPRVLMEKALPQLAAHVTDDPQQSLFHRPIDRMPDGFGEADRRRLGDAYEAAIRDTVVPAYARLHAFVRDEYLPRARSTVGLDALPDGKAWYAHRVRTITTTDLTPGGIHDIGLREVARIHGEMERIRVAVGFEGDLHAFFDWLETDPRFYFDDPEELLNGYREMKARINGLVPRLFDIFPRADYEVRAVEAFRERSASGASYQSGPPDGSRPGVFYVNTYDLSARPSWAMESLSLHEAAPGHHFQRSIQRELEALPRFRRFGTYTAYVEGWGLYAESLGRELGVYEDPYQHFGALAAELWRAIRLVVDTGLHSKGWTREEVLDYMDANTSVGEARAVSEAERYIAIPGQALAYKIGQLRIAELRARAEERLGDRFDVKAFHRAVLEDGALPLDVLSGKIDRFIAGRAEGVSAAGS